LQRDADARLVPSELITRAETSISLSFTDFVLTTDSSFTVHSRFTHNSLTIHSRVKKYISLPAVTGDVVGRLLTRLSVNSDGLRRRLNFLVGVRDCKSPV
jgi:hypothetical protein